VSAFVLPGAVLLLGGLPGALAGAPAGLVRPPSSVAVSVHRRVLLGHSVEGRPIVAVETGNPGSSEKVLVVGCTHGDECAGIAVAKRLIAAPPPTRADIWIVPNLNPDGAARGSRSNAHGVDLNRNFPWKWQPLHGIYDSGPHPLSEPESRIAYALIRRLHPTLSLWFHQHLGLIDESGGSVAIERRFAALVSLPPARLPREPGSITTWQDNTSNGTAFVVELRAGPLSQAEASTFAHAIETLAGQPASP
jgi:protein MpaA